MSASTIPVEPSPSSAPTLDGSGTPGTDPLPSVPGIAYDATACDVDPATCTGQWADIAEPVFPEPVALVAPPPVIPETGAVTDGLVYAGGLLLFVGICCLTSRRWGR